MAAKTAILLQVVVDIKKTQSIVRDALPTLHVSLLAVSFCSTNSKFHSYGFLNVYTKDCK